MAGECNIGTSDLIPLPFIPLPSPRGVLDCGSAALCLCVENLLHGSSLGRGIFCPDEAPKTHLHNAARPVALVAPWQILP
jgi:hypothetical protein